MAGRADHPLDAAGRHAPRDRHDLSGARPRRRPLRRGEHLPRARDVQRRLVQAWRAERRGAQGPRPPGARRDRHQDRGRHALERRQADREHGPRALARRPADRHGRALGGAGAQRGRQPVPHDPRAAGPGRRGRLHLPSPRGDPRDRGPAHRPQGRSHRGHQPPRGHHPDVGGDRADDRAHDRVRLPATARPPAARRAAQGAEPGPGQDVPRRLVHRRCRRDRRHRRAGRRGTLRGARDRVRRQAAYGRDRHHERPQAARRPGRRRRQARAWVWRPRSGRARPSCSTSRSCATSPWRRCRATRGSDG